LLLYIQFRLISVFKKAVPWLRDSVAGISPQRPGFNTRPVHVRFVVDKVAMEQVSLIVLQFLPRQYYSTSDPFSSSSTERQMDEA
jgi:hypothetical protein